MRNITNLRFPILSLRGMKNKHLFSTSAITKFLDFSDSYRVNEHVENMFRKKDKVPDNFRLIYKMIEPMNYELMHTGANVGLGGVIAGGIYLLFNDVNPVVSFLGIDFENAQPLMYTCYFLSVIFISVLKHLLFRIAQRIYYDQSSNAYKIISLSNIPLIPTYTQFVHPNTPLLVKSPLNYVGVTKIVVQEKSIYLFQEYFRTTIDCHNLIDGEHHVYD